MRKFQFSFTCFFIILLLSCSNHNNPPEGKLINNAPDLETSSWHTKDADLDSIPGISLDKAYNLILQDKIGTPITIALLDTQVDITHEDLKNQIFSNTNEISYNGIDDDNNGYIDDKNGWNFLGTPDGKSVYYGSPDHIRIIKRLEHKFLNKKTNQISKEDSLDYKKYLKALRLKEEDIALAENRIDYGERLWKAYKETFAAAFPDSFLDKASLDTIIPQNENEHFLLRYLKNVERLNMTADDMFTIQKEGIHRKFTMNNLNYNDRLQIGDDIYNYEDLDYGNQYVGKQAELYLHGTQVAGIIAAQRDNKLGIKGISNSISLMVCSISPLGDELDKDFYNAIKYAADNGARIVNFSSGKRICDNEEVLIKALKYAEDRDVLIITSSGNQGTNIDIADNIYYPIDSNSNDNIEFVSNLLVVGASGEFLDATLNTKFSNYGSKNVDIFAPGINLKTTHANDEKYITLGGTSIATGITSGVAALIRSHYPSLTAPEVKQILMDSSVKYDILVDLPTKENPEQQLPFSELSKSGGIVNAYNALLMAEEVVERKKK